MKTIEQLLELSKNPHYKFLPEEQQVLDDFLFKQREKALKSSPKTNLPNSESNTPVTVRNVVPKIVDRVQDASEPTDVR